MKLTRVMELEEIISSTRDELESLRAKASAPSPSKLDGLPHAAQMSSRVETLTVKIVDTEKELADLREEYAIALIDLAEEIYRRVNGRAATILFEQYVGGKSIPEIAKMMDLSASRVRQLKSDGLKAFEQSTKRGCIQYTPPASTESLRGQETV